MNLLFSYFKQIVYTFFLLYHKCLLYMNQVFQIKIESISPEKKYYSIILEKFQKYISENREYKNQNIDPIFYQQKEYNEYMKTENNSIESLWKTRILMDYNPRGNVIMFYDPYKMGFSYYCDQNVVPYEILNAVAMKYVMNFQCYDFFLDELILPEKNPLKIHYLEEKKEISKTKVLKNESFVKLKKSEVSKNSNPSVEDKKESTNAMKNKFIYLGNIRNFRITQPILKKQCINGFKSSMLDGLNNHISYMEFKRLKEEREKQKQHLE
jgi:hypothetical protein